MPMLPHQRPFPLASLACSSNPRVSSVCRFHRGIYRSRTHLPSARFTRSSSKPTGSQTLLSFLSCTKMVSPWK
jgi:hypothetical protein